MDTSAPTPPPEDTETGDVPRTRLVLLAALVPVLLALVVGAWPASAWYARWRTAALEARCREAREAGDWAHLEDTASSWTEWDDDSTTAWLFLAEVAEHERDPQRLVECLGKVQDDDPRAAVALWRRTELLFEELNRPLDAVETCRRILEIDPLNYPARRRLTFYYAITRQRQHLIDLVRDSIARRREAPEAYVYLLLSSNLTFSNGYHLTSRWLDSAPEQEEFLVARAIHGLHSTPDVFATPEERQRTSPEALLERFPDNVELLAHHLSQAVDEGRLDAVERLLGQCPDEANRDSRILLARAWLHAARNDLAQATRTLRMALEHDVYDWRARHELATVLRRRGYVEEASRASELAAEGKALERVLLEMPDAAAIDTERLERIAAYAERLDDTHVAEGIRFRLSPQAPAPQGVPELDDNWSASLR